MRIEVFVETNRVGSRVTDVIEVDDDATESDIDAIAQQQMFEMISWGWKKLEDE